MREKFNLQGTDEVFILKIYRYLDRPKSSWGNDKEKNLSRTKFEEIH